MAVKTKTDGICPYCKSTNIEYGTMEVEDESIYYPIDCNDCDKTSKEWYGLKKLSFFEILDSIEVVPAMIDVQVHIRYSVGDDKRDKVVTARCVCEKEAFQAYTDGKWGVNPISIIKEEEYDSKIHIVKTEKESEVKNEKR